MNEETPETENSRKRITGEVGAEVERLEREVIEKAVEAHKAELAAYCGNNTIARTSMLVKAIEAGKARREAVQALIDFESKQEES